MPLKYLKHPHMNRRAFIAGSFGSLLGLPLLEASINNNGDKLKKSDSDLPLNYFSLFGGVALTTDHINTRNLLKPDLFGLIDKLPVTLSPISEFDLKKQIAIISNLEIPYGNGAGESSGYFHDTNYLSSISGLNNIFAYKNSYFNSPDIIFQKANKPRNNLTISAQLSSYETRGLRSISYSQKNGFHKPNTNLYNIYKGLISNSSSDSKLDYILTQKKTSLDLFYNQIKKIYKKIGQADIHKINKYLSDLRDLERKIFTLALSKQVKCYPSLKYFKKNMNKDYEKEFAYKNEKLRAEISIDLMYLYLISQKSRSVNLMLTQPHSNLNSYPFTGISTSIHRLSHQHKNHSAINGIETLLKWHVHNFCHLCKKLSNSSIGNTNMLELSAGSLFFEGGAGLDYNSPKLYPNRVRPHSGQDMVVLVAGNSKKLNLGLHINGKKNHPTKVFTSLLNSLNINIHKIGNISGLLANLSKLL